MAQPFDCLPSVAWTQAVEAGERVGRGVLYYRGDKAVALKVAHLVCDGVSPLRETPDRCSVRPVEGVWAQGKWWERIEIMVRYRPSEERPCSPPSCASC